MKTYLIHKVITLGLIFCFSACSLLDDSGEPAANDPAGTVSVNMRDFKQGGSWLKIDDRAIGFVFSSNNFNCYNDGGIVDVGQCKLGKVKSIPSSTSWSAPVAAKIGHSYIVRGRKNGNPVYLRFYVVDWLISASSNGILGVAIKYQYPFTPENS